MTDDSKVLPFQKKTLTPGPGGRTITVSYDHLVLLFDAFETTATGLQSKLELLAEFYGMLPGHDEVGKRKALTGYKDEQQNVAQVLVDLRAMRADAAHHVN